MDPSATKSILPVALRRFSPRSLCRGGALALIAAMSAQVPAYAQEKTDSSSAFTAVPAVAPTPLACVPSELASSILSEGNAVRVDPVPQQNSNQQHKPEAAVTAGAGPSGLSDRTARNAYKIFEREARQGRSAAMVNLAVFSLAGWGTPPNAGAALYWLHAAADRGYAPAFYNLGVLYFKGCGVHQDYAEAFRFFEQGARGGDAAAEVNLGYLYAHGLGVRTDLVAAARVYRHAAESGDPQAQYEVADLYLHGEGIAQDDAEAFAWFQKAALQGHSGARILLGAMYATGRGTGKDTATAYMWVAAAAMQGDTRANARLSLLERELTAGELAEAKLRAKSLAHGAVLTRDVALLH